MAAFANRFARVAGRVAVVGEDAEAVVEARGEIVQLGELVLRERLGGEEVERARVRILEHGIQDRQVVAERLAGGRRRDHDEVFSGARKFRRGGLVRIELLDSLGAIGCGELGAHPGRHRPELRLARGNVFDGGEDLVRAIAGSQRAEYLFDGVECRMLPYSQTLRGRSHAASLLYSPFVRLR